MKSLEPIYVSLTSWHKRINNVKPVIETILKQTLQPHKIILNLCIQDFPKMEKDLPQDLLELIDTNDIELYWFYENYKAWKKHLHVLDILPDDALALCMDDDHLYPADYIEKMYISYCYYGKQFPVTSNKIMLLHSAWCFNGSGTLYRKSDWGDYKKFLTYDILHNTYEDVFISVLFYLNKHPLAPIIFNIPEDSKMLFNDNDSFSDVTNKSKEEAEQVYAMNDNTIVNIIDTFDMNWNNDVSSFKYRPNVWQIMYEFYESFDKSNLKYPAFNFSYSNFNKLCETGTLSANNYDIDFKSIGLDKQLTTKSECITSVGSYVPNIIVSISSWNKRIKNVYTVINDILHNSFVPDKIILNLAKSDFVDIVGDLTDYELDLKTLVFKDKFPRDLYDLIQENNDIIEVHWYNDASLKSWKKYVYVTQTYKDDIIIVIDDDVRYSTLFIETMIKSYHYYGSKYPISIFQNFCQGGFALSGQAFLFTPKMLDYLNPKYFTDEVLHNFPEDNHILNIVNYLEYPILPVIGYDYLFADKQDLEDNDANFGNDKFDEAWFSSYHKLMDISIKILNDNKKDYMCQHNYKPACFNYCIYNLEHLINDYDRNSLPEYSQYVYDAIKIYLEDSPGTKFSSDLHLKIRHVFL